MQAISIAFVALDPAYDTVLGRKIQEMRVKALKDSAGPLVEEFMRMYRELGDATGVEAFDMVICAGDYGKGQPDLYELACNLEDCGPAFCANHIGVKLKRESADRLLMSFAKRTEIPAVSPFNGGSHL